LKYRAEIDGLRALAVVPVILFHAGFEFFSGGFVGVDVFFVISGYLITTILIDDIEKNRFSLVNFYERRARRILPVLFFVMFVCVPFAWMWMLPSQMKDFSQSLIAVSFFASNILFWRESGYFDAAAEEKPLLHTWSLAVEEQYYVLFPIFLFFAWRYGKNKVFWMLVVFSAFSLALSEWGWRNNETANFYLAPTRAWELFAGSIAAFVVQKRGVQKNDALSLLGLAGIVFSIFAYDESTPFPSVYALVPVLGVVLLILYADKDTLAAKLLSTKAFVGVGLISYSAYLWHQPLFEFARIRLINHPSELVMLTLSLGSIVLAYLSWKYIENPFRNKNSYQRKYIFVGSFVGMLAFSFLGIVGHVNGGFNNRFSTDNIKLINTAGNSPLRPKCHFPQEIESLERSACTYFSGVASVAVLGNSHGTELAYALAKELKEVGTSIVQHTMSACRHNYEKNDEAESVCYKWHSKVVDSLLRDNAVKTVILSYRNERYIENTSYRESLIDIATTLAASNKKIILVLQAPLPGAHISKYIQSSIISKSSDVKGLTKSEWNNIYLSKKDLLNEIPSEIFVVDPEELLCEKNGCFVIKDGRALYFDEDHLSIEGAGIVARFIVNNYILQ
jgi:peptidoglycan/LPS O-acetylase OafA/YrhL